MDCDVFISYSSRDRDFVIQLKKELEQMGVHCWRDKDDLMSGAEFMDEIAEALEAVQIMVLIFSSTAMDSKYVKDELTYAHGKGMHIIPIKIEEIALQKSWKLMLGGRHWEEVIERSQERIIEIAKRIKKNVDIFKAGREREEKEIEVLADTKAHAVSDLQQGEKKLLNALHVAYEDGSITGVERDTINSIAMHEGVSTGRMKELESKVRADLGIIGTDAPVSESIPAGEAMEWPEIGIQFLRKLKAAVEPKLPFEPRGISSEEEEEENWGVWWYVSDKHHYAAWLYNKHTPNVSLSYGFHSDNEKRDPLFRTIADDLQSKGVVPDAEDDDTDEGGCFFLPEGELGVYAEKRIRIDELASPALLEETSACFSDFITKTWPVISPHYVK